MSELDEIRSILVEMRDDQRSSLEKQDEHIALAQQQLDRARTQVEESLDLQREAMAKQKTIIRIALPGVLACIALIIYLIVRYL